MTWVLRLLLRFLLRFGLLGPTVSEVILRCGCRISDHKSQDSVSRLDAWGITLNKAKAAQPEKTKINFQTGYRM